MTREETIATLKANYPDACFEQLRDAVDTAISVLKQPEVIHCRDCMWYGYYSCELHGNSWMRDGNGYCDRAERRTDENNNE